MKIRTETTFRVSSTIALCMAMVLTSTISTSAAQHPRRTAGSPTPPSAAEVEQFVRQTNQEVRSWRILGSADDAGLVGDLITPISESQSGLKFDADGAEAFDIGGAQTLVRIPAEAGQGVETQSTLTALFDSERKLIGTTEFLFSSRTVNSGLVQVWADGRLVIDQVVSAPAASESVRDSGNSDYHRGDWWGNFNECLSNAGVAAWVITGLSIACAAVCVATVGLGCVICLGAASAGFSGTVSYCIVQANARS